MSTESVDDGLDAYFASVRRDARRLRQAGRIAVVVPPMRFVLKDVLYS